MAHNVTCGACSHCSYIHEYEIYFCHIRERRIQEKYIDIKINCSHYEHKSEEETKNES